MTLVGHLIFSVLANVRNELSKFASTLAVAESLGIGPLEEPDGRELLAGVSTSALEGSMECSLGDFGFTSVEITSS